MSRAEPVGRDFFRAPWCYAIWGIPVSLATAAGYAYQGSVLSLPVTGAVWVAAVAWIGLACLINGRSCGRVHCLIDGIALPILSVVGALNVLSIITLPWNAFWLSFGVILVASFVPEFVWRKYARTAGSKSVTCAESL